MSLQTVAWDFHEYLRLHWIFYECSSTTSTISKTSAAASTATVAQMVLLPQQGKCQA